METPECQRLACVAQPTLASVLVTLALGPVEDGSCCNVFMKMLPIKCTKGLLIWQRIEEGRMK